MKKIICIVLIVLSILGMAGCNIQQPNDGKIHIVCTIYPQYDWVQKVIGADNDRFSVQLLMENGVDLHNYQATPADLADIAACDLFIYVGGESDAWAVDALKNPQNKNRKTLALLDIAEAIEEEHEHEEGEAHEHEADEHVWLSLRKADQIVEQIGKLISELDPDHAETYTKNTADYRAALSELEGRYQATIEGGVRKTVIFADRFPFRHLAHDYELQYHAAFSGCSAESEVSFSTMAKLIESVDREKVPCVLITESGDRALAETVVSGAAQKDLEILVMNSIQAIGREQIDAGASYLAMMESNLEILKKALY